ncbi:hypothetical protein NFI96_003663 [Prochilodus magdalenae]|nr:hypothetical protein NFI96_003663 [Prochilodus magdalenae]
MIILLTPPVSIVLTACPSQPCSRDPVETFGLDRVISVTRHTHTGIYPHGLQTFTCPKVTAPVRVLVFEFLLTVWHMIPTNRHAVSGMERAVCAAGPFLIDVSSASTPGPALQPSDVFEQPLTLGPKKIEFHISAEVSNVLEASVQPKEPNTAEEEEVEEEAVWRRAAVFANPTRQTSRYGAVEVPNGVL